MKSTLHRVLWRHCQIHKEFYRPVKVEDMAEPKPLASWRFVIASVLVFASIFFTYLAVLAGLVGGSK